MTSRERMLAALNREQPDRLPVTTHHVMPYFLQKYMVGMSNDEFFDWFVTHCDSELIAIAHEAGQRIVYHTCGGMMPIPSNGLPICSPMP